MKLIVAKIHIFLLNLQQENVTSTDASTASQAVGCTEGEAIYALKRLVDKNLVDEYVSLTSPSSAHNCWNGLHSTFMKILSVEDCAECGEPFKNGVVTSTFSLK